MPRSTRTYRIFVASPGDVQRERDAMLGVVNEMNRILDALLPDEGFRVELLRWEENVAPQIGDGPQAVVNEQIEPYDIFLGVLAKHFGTPTAVAGSGTEEEFRLAHSTWRKHGTPRITFFFNTGFEPPQRPDEHAQLDRVKAFRAELGSKGIVGKYHGAELFASAVLRPLLQIIGTLIKEEREVQSVLPPASDRSTWSVAGEPVPIGTRVKIVDIGEKDACYHRRDKYIGPTGVILEAQWLGQWLRGTFRFDTPLFDGDDGRYTFLQFQVAELKGPESK